MRPGIGEQHRRLECRVASPDDDGAFSGIRRRVVQAAMDDVPILARHIETPVVAGSPDGDDDASCSYLLSRFGMEYECGACALDSVDTRLLDGDPVFDPLPFEFGDEVFLDSRPRRPCARRGPCRAGKVKIGLRAGKSWIVANGRAASKTRNVNPREAASTAALMPDTPPPTMAISAPSGYSACRKPGSEAIVSTRTRAALQGELEKRDAGQIARGCKDPARSSVRGNRPRGVLSTAPGGNPVWSQRAYARIESVNVRKRPRAAAIVAVPGGRIHGQCGSSATGVPVRSKGRRADGWGNDGRGRWAPVIPCSRRRAGRR